MKSPIFTFMGLLFALGLSACANNNEALVVRGPEDCRSNEVYINSASACSRSCDIADVRDLSGLQNNNNMYYGGGYGMNGQNMNDIRSQAPGCNFPGINPYTGECVMGTIGTRDIYTQGINGQYGGAYGGGYGMTGYCAYGGNPQYGNQYGGGYNTNYRTQNRR